MLATLKSDIRKLLSVRSTYFVSALALILISVYIVYIEGIWGKSGSAAASATVNDLAFREVALGSLTAISLFLAIIVILQVVHEYRHNTIMYTLTASNSRTKVLLAKTIALVSFAVFLSLFSVAYAIGVYVLTLSIRGVDIPPQTIDWLSVVGKGVFYNVGYAGLGFIIAYLSRNIAAAIAIFLIVPSTVEGLLSLVLRSNAIYLPFSALNTVISTSGSESIVPGSNLSVAKAIGLVSVYLVIGWLITWALFLRRDAN